MKDELHPVTVHLPAKLVKELEQEAEELDQSLSAFIKDILVGKQKPRK